MTGFRPGPLRAWWQAHVIIYGQPDTVALVAASVLLAAAAAGLVAVFTVAFLA